MTPEQRMLERVFSEDFERVMTFFAKSRWLFNGWEDLIADIEQHDLYTRWEPWACHLQWGLWP